MGNSTYYYKNREKILKKVREYDRTHKKIKKAYDKKRRLLKGYNQKKAIQHYSQRNHLPILIKKYKECQLKLEGCLINKKLEIHHKKYTKKIKDCLLICQNCHKKIHRKIENRNI